MGLTLTEPVPEAFEFPAFDWPEKNQRRGSLMPSYTKWFSSSIAILAVRLAAPGSPRMRIFKWERNI